MSHSLQIGQRVTLQLKEFENRNTPVHFTITGFSKYNQYDINNNQLVNILHVDKDLKFTRTLAVYFTLVTAADS